MCSSRNIWYFYIHAPLFASSASWLPCWRLLRYHLLWAALLDHQVSFSCISVRMPSAADKYKTVAQSAKNNWEIYYFVHQEMHEWADIKVVRCSDLQCHQEPRSSRSQFCLRWLPDDHSMAAVVPDVTARHSSDQHQKEPISPDIFLFSQLPKASIPSGILVYKSSFAYTPKLITKKNNRNLPLNWG